MSLLFRLLLTFFRIGLFSIGGGYAMIPLIHYELVEAQGWLTAQEITDIVAISQMTPGPFAINAAVFSGVKLASVGGAIFAMLGVVLPSLIIASIAARMLFSFQKTLVVRGLLRGMSPIVVGLILTAALSIANTVIFNGGIAHVLTLAADAAIQNIDFVAAAIAAASAVALFKFKLNPLWIILGSGALGLLTYFIGI